MISLKEFQSKTITIRGLEVVFDIDLAEFYEIELKVLHKIVKQNIDRFPNDFMIEISPEYLKCFKSEINKSKSSVKKKSTRQRYYTFTMRGIMMLNMIINSEIGRKESFNYIENFIRMSEHISENEPLYKQIEELKNEKIEAKNIMRSFKERDIFYIKMGHNIGFEQDGKGKDFTRSVIILRKLTKDLFIGIPTTTKYKEGSFFYNFEFKEKTLKGIKLNKDTAILAQIRVFSSARLINNIGVISKEDFFKLKDRLKDLIIG